MPKSGQTGEDGAQASPEARVIDAILSEIAETGLAGLSIDRVAARAAVSKTTIYSRWRTKDDLIVAAFAAATSRPVEVDSERGLRIALRQMFERGKQFCADDRYETLLAELLAAAHSNDEVHALVDSVRRNWRAATTTMLERGRSAGELPGDTDIDFLVELLAALMTYRTVSPVFDEPYSEETYRRIEALVLETPPRRLPAD